MTSPGQSDRMRELIRKYRSAGMSFMDAMHRAEQAVREEDVRARMDAHRARRVSGRAMNDTVMDLMCRGDMSAIARLERIAEIERQHRGK